MRDEFTMSFEGTLKNGENFKVTIDFNNFYASVSDFQILDENKIIYKYPPTNTINDKYFKDHIK